MPKSHYFHIEFEARVIEHSLFNRRYVMQSSHGRKTPNILQTSVEVGNNCTKNDHTTQEPHISTSLGLVWTTSRSHLQGHYTRYCI
jgi:hypothetical protein